MYGANFKKNKNYISIYLFVYLGNVSAGLSYDMYDTKIVEVNNDYAEISFANKKVGMDYKLVC